MVNVYEIVKPVGLEAVLEALIDRGFRGLKMKTLQY